VPRLRYLFGREGGLRASSDFAFRQGLKGSLTFEHRVRPDDGANAVQQDLFVCGLLITLFVWVGFTPRHALCDLSDWGWGVPPKLLGRSRAMPLRKNCVDFLDPRSALWRKIASNKFRQEDVGNG
jgi:hypothetical protein